MPGERKTEVAKTTKKKSNQIPWVQFVYPSSKDRGPKRTNVKAASQDLDKLSKDLDNLQSVTKVAPTQGSAEELSAALSKSNKDTEKAIDMGKELLRKYQILLNANQQLQADNDELKQQVASTNDLRQEYATARKKYTELIKTLEDLVDGLREENEKLRQHQRIENQPVKKMKLRRRVREKRVLELAQSNTQQGGTTKVEAKKVEQGKRLPLPLHLDLLERK